MFTALGGGQTAIPHGELRTTTVNGIEAAYSSTTANSNGGQVDVTVFAYHWDASNAYHFVLITQAGSGLGPFSSLVNSMTRLTTEQANAIQSRRITVVTVGPGDTATSLANRMAYADNKLERFRVLNALDANATLRVGQKVKLVVLTR